MELSQFHSSPRVRKQYFKAREKLLKRLNATWQEVLPPDARSLRGTCEAFFEPFAQFGVALYDAYAEDLLKSNLSEKDYLQALNFDLKTLVCDQIHPYRAQPIKTLQDAIAADARGEPLDEWTVCMGEAWRLYDHPRHVSASDKVRREFIDLYGYMPELWGRLLDLVHNAISRRPSHWMGAHAERAESLADAAAPSPVMPAPVGDDQPPEPGIGDGAMEFNKLKATAETELRDAILSEFLKPELPAPIALLRHCERYTTRVFDGHAALRLKEDPSPEDYSKYLGAMVKNLPVLFFGCSYEAPGALRGHPLPISKQASRASTRVAPGCLWGRCIEYAVLAVVDHGPEPRRSEDEILGRYIDINGHLSLTYALQTRADFWVSRARSADPPSEAAAGDRIPKAGQAGASGKVETIQSGSEPAAQKKRGRPQTIPDERKAAAAEAKASGKTNKEAAALLYGTKYPSDQQRKNVPGILKHFNQRNNPPGSSVQPRKTSQKPNKNEG